ncbi:hypothetical protein N7535_008507 [Penicillium sp. DV-2018c]|nr:hypothetical protein N7461_002266 [Penicillium sp. DV-2018c]KAJ5563343.1 hypothetical protein N7535_008507 [Penicillium sp. DV-2018c]
MSAPTRQFNRLSIGRNMSQTTLPARVARAGRPDPSNDDSDREEDDSSSGESSNDGDEADKEDESSDEEESASTSASVLAASGIAYDLSQLDSELEANAVVGLNGGFDVVNCRSTAAGYDFQLLDRPRVHIGPDSSNCSCYNFQSRPDGACQHIFWLLDQLHGCFLSAPQSMEVALTPDGRPDRLPPIETLVKGDLGSVATRLKWQYLSDEDSTGKGMTRTEKVRDIFSAFSNRLLPEDTRRDLTETTEQTRTAEQCVVQGDFEATMFRLAVHDDGVFNSLCKAMPAGACAAIYFDKIQQQTRRLLNDFDRYCTTGELPAEPVSSGLGVEVNDVVTQLHLAVSRITSNIATRAPHGSEGAAEALVSLLESVVARNNDPLEGNPLGRETFHGEDEDQRNLYHILIGSVETDSETDARHFVLHALEALPPADLHQCANRLRDILRKIEVNRAPKPYLIHLGNIIRIAESAGSGATGSGQKRPATGNGNAGGYSKRTR